MNILVIDDEVEILGAIRDALVEDGHTVATATQGAEGLHRLGQPPASGPFDVVLVDLMMPVMDGEGFLEALSELEDAQRPSVIVMTASRRIPTSVLPIRILRKPIELEHLLRMIQEKP